MRRFPSIRLCLCCFSVAVLALRSEAEELPHACPRLVIELCRAGEGISQGRLLNRAGGVKMTFPVGYGREGWLAEGSRFRGGYSLLGRFKINAILAIDRFVPI